MNKSHPFKVMLTNAAMGLTLVCLLAILGFQLFAQKIHSNQPFDTIQAKVSEGLDPNLYPPISTASLRRYLDLDPALFNQIVLLRNEDALSARELCLVWFDQPQAGNAFEQAVEQRIYSQKDIYEGYAPEQTALMENALVDIEDNYALYYVGDNPQTMQNTFQNALKGGQ